MLKGENPLLISSCEGEGESSLFSTLCREQKVDAFVGSRRDHLSSHLISARGEILLSTERYAFSHSACTEGVLTEWNKISVSMMKVSWRSLTEFDWNWKKTILGDTCSRLV